MTSQSSTRVEWHCMQLPFGAQADGLLCRLRAAPRRRNALSRGRPMVSLRSLRECRQRQSRKRVVRVVEELRDVLRIVHSVRATGEDVVVEGAGLILRQQASVNRAAGYRVVLGPVAVAEL